MKETISICLEGLPKSKAREVHAPESVNGCAISRREWTVEWVNEVKDVLWLLLNVFDSFVKYLQKKNWAPLTKWYLVYEEEISKMITIVDEGT